MSARVGYRSIVVVVACAVLAGGGAWWWHGASAAEAAAAASAAPFKTSQEAQNVYVRFDMEAYDDIEADYWQAGSDAQFAQLFQLSLAKAAGTSSEELATSTRAGVAQMLSRAFEGLSTTSEEALALQTLQVALYNLTPTGRSQLLSSQAERQLTNTVDNVHPSDDLYGDLGLPQDASSSAIAHALAQKTAELSASSSPEAKQALAKVAQAGATLANPTAKAAYDATGAQASVVSRILNPHTLYIGISSVAPTTIGEFKAAVDAASSSPSLDQLVLDLRGNIGGDLSFTQDLLALFFGPNQYAFDLYHQGNLQVQRTSGLAQDQTLSRFKQIAVLTDSMTQSTAELAASALKHDHLAYTVGTTTRGWGSVEKIIPLTTEVDPNETYALELVEYLTVRYDGLPIEGNGVAPDVDVNDAGWKSRLSDYFYSPYLISGIEAAVSRPPMQ